MLLQELLGHAGARDARDARNARDARDARDDRVALVCGDRRLTYRQLDEMTARFAHGLRRLGVRRGERVVMCLDNGVEHVVALFGVWKAGAVAVPVSPQTKRDKLARILADTTATTLIRNRAEPGDARPHELAASLQRVIAVHGARAAHSFDDVAAAQVGDDAPPAGPPRETDLAAILYTSGSTGVPKGVMHTHRSLTSATSSIVTYLGLDDSDVVLQVLPLSFGYGLSQLLTTFAVGARLVLERSFAYPQVTLRRIAAERATTFALVPTMAALLVAADLSAQTHDLSSLRRITSAGAALAPSLALALRTQLPHARLFIMYGQTECIRATYLPPDEVERRTSSVGRGIPGQEHWLVDENGQRLPPGIAATGELVVRGPHVMAGYWRNPDATAAKLGKATAHEGVERELHTGDVFHMDADGWLTFVARKDDIIKTRGEKVSPREVEDVLYGLPTIAEAAVVGVPDALLGSVVKAFVTLRDVDARAASNVDMRARATQIQAHCAAHLEDFAVPKLIEVLRELPKTVNGKVDKQALLDPLAHRPAGTTHPTAHPSNNGEAQTCHSRETP